jgi:Pyruvate/2-oxoacid:ferredoxin oxidoreductase gamma subunit
MITPAKERMRKSRAHRRLGLRPVQVLVSEREIDFLLAHDYELSRKDADSIGRAVAQFLSDSALFASE